MVARGEVWWHEAPDEKPRPVAVLTRAAAVDVMAKVLAAPATRTVRGIPSEVPLGPDDGMPVECVLALDNLAPVRKGHLVRHVATLSAARMVEVCQALRDATDS